MSHRRPGAGAAPPWPRLAAALAALAALAGPPAAAGKPPTLTGLFPPGAERGRTATVTASGSFDRWPVEAWVDGPGVEVRAAQARGELTVRVADDAEPGLRWVRLYDKDGATEPRPFVVGTLPEAAEAEPNDEPGQAQPVSPPAATVNGRLAKRGDVDGFAVALARGQTLVADLEANRRLGAPMDGVLQVVSPSGFVLAQNDDAVGRDPRVVFEAPAAGTYVVRAFAFPATPDSGIRFSGGDAFVYRLTLTTGGFLDHAFPPAVSRDGRGEVAAAGYNLPDPPPRLAVRLPGGDADSVPVSHPLLAGLAEVRRVAGRLAAEAEPDGPAAPQEVFDRGVVAGRIDPAGDVDAFRVTLKAGDKRVARVESRSLGFPLDPVLRVLGPDGKPVAEADDAGQKRDPELTFIAAADGAYRLVVRDLNGRGGPRFAYLLSLSAAEPDFALGLAADRFDAAPGKPAKVTVKVDRRNGDPGPVEVAAVDLPPGFRASAVTSAPSGDSSKSVTLEILADPGARPGPFRVVGRSLSGPLRVRHATAAVPGFEAAKTDLPWVTPLPAPEPPGAAAAPAAR